MLSLREAFGRIRERLNERHFGKEAINVCLNDEVVDLFFDKPLGNSKGVFSKGSLNLLYSGEVISWSDEQWIYLLSFIGCHQPYFWRAAHLSDGDVKADFINRCAILTGAGLHMFEKSHTCEGCLDDQNCGGNSCIDDRLRKRIDLYIQSGKMSNDILEDGFRDPEICYLNWCDLLDEYFAYAREMAAN